MIRFYGRQAVEGNPDAGIIIADEQIFYGGGVWTEVKDYFRRHVSEDAADIKLLPIVNAEQETLCYAYQDREANRELRMLRELKEHKDALQFKDIFPDIREVAVCGCNELAYHFVKYLETQQIPVAVSGKYWDWFGYDGRRDVDLEDAAQMIVYAEGIWPKTGDIFEAVKRSASPEFECVNKIYEANVLAGKIKDAEGTVEELLDKLRGRDIIILGTDARAQDAYDFLYEHGIDICCFAEWREDKSRCSIAGPYHQRPGFVEWVEHKNKTLLGKKAIGIKESINNKMKAVVISSSDRNSALGTAEVDFFDYYGYERNKNFFLLRDYMEMSCTNLLHVLKGKSVFFAGDQLLCGMVMDYLKRQGDIFPEYVELWQLTSLKETDVFCAIDPCYGHFHIDFNPKSYCFWDAVGKAEVPFYTDYFSQVRTLVSIDLDRNKHKEKYSIKELRPKGILLGKIPLYNGCGLFRGILDGHPDIIKLDYTYLNDYLFLYCVRLAGKKAEDILTAFRGMYNKESNFEKMYRRDSQLPPDQRFGCWEQFEKSAKERLSLKDSFTSQELFVIFHLAYAEMVDGVHITDLDQKIIYWEPHMVSRDNFPYFAQWLDDEKIQGQTVVMHRDMLVGAGTMQKVLGWREAWMFKSLMPEETVSDGIIYRQWKEFHVRFEDVKLYPQQESQKLCDGLGLPWSDVMLQVTDRGRSWESIWGVPGLDIKPVFNRYEEYHSEFDRFKISILCSPYQKKYGYIYEDCVKFSRGELQEMFLKEFRWQGREWVESEGDRQTWFLRIYQELMDVLWKVRKRMLMDDIVPEFGGVEIGTMTTPKEQKTEIVKPAEYITQEELDRLIAFVRNQEQLVLYGIGGNCEALLERLDGEEQLKIKFSDLKAEYQEVLFHGQKVIAPSKLCEAFKDYKILVTPNEVCQDIQQQLESMGVAPDRIVCNQFRLWRQDGDA